jgi:hypothetical protein
VDDFVVATGNFPFYKKIFAALSLLFKLKDLGLISLYLAIGIISVPGKSVHLDQRAYIERMGARFGLADAKSEKLPLTPGINLSKADAPVTKEEISQMSTTPYRSIIGSLLYAGRGTRPDIAFGVSLLSRFNQAPGPKHWKAAKKLLRYLLSTPTMGLNYTNLGSVQIEIFSDSDWGSDVDTRRSVSGYIVKISNGPVSWLSRSQKTAALSSCEAEFLALNDAVKETLWLRHVLDELHVEYVSPITIKIDNQAAINLSKNAVNHQRTKHIDIRYFRIREEVENKRIRVEYVPTDQNISDLLTKAVTAKQFFNLVGQLIQ